MRFLFMLLAIQTMAQEQTDLPVGGQCEDCELMYEGMPKKLPGSTTLSPEDEPGEKLIIRGRIFRPDGKTPAPGVVLYLYHTNAKGLYSKSTLQKTGLRHGHLRGWIETDAQGQYQFITIRPASYPGEKIPQHIHAIVKERELTLYWIDDFVFDDDPLLTKKERARLENRGGNGIIQLTKNRAGVWIGQRDIVLGKHVPGYPKN